LSLRKNLKDEKTGRKKTISSQIHAHSHRTYNTHDTKTQQHHDKKKGTGLTKSDKHDFKSTQKNKTYFLLFLALSGSFSALSASLQAAVLVAAAATKAVVRARYNMAAFSVEERKRPGPDRRSIELSKVISEALSNVVFVEYFPRASIDVFIEVISADGGTRTTSLTAASLALADAGIPMRDIVAAVAVGKVDGVLVLDIDQVEDNFGEADMPVAAAPALNEITLLQLNGTLTREEFEEGLDLALKGINEIYRLQKEALRNKYLKIEVEE